MKALTKAKLTSLLHTHCAPQNLVVLVDPLISLGTVDFTVDIAVFDVRKVPDPALVTNSPILLVILAPENLSWGSISDLIIIADEADVPYLWIVSLPHRFVVSVDGSSATILTREMFLKCPAISRFTVQTSDLFSAV